MYKLKTSKSIKKRFKVSKTNKLSRHKANRSHLLNKKSSKRRRHLRASDLCKKGDLHNIKNQIPYEFR